MKANHFEPALKPTQERSVADPAVILCLNMVSFICLYLFMCHEVSQHILEYPFMQKPWPHSPQQSAPSFPVPPRFSIWRLLVPAMLQDDLGPDYMRPVRTQTGTTSDRSPYKCLFLFTLGRSEKPSHAGFTHSGC